VSCAAALATLDVLCQPGVHAGLNAAGNRFREILRGALSDAGETGQVLGDGPMAQIAFSPVPIVDQATWLASNRARGRKLMLELLRTGVFLNPMGTKLYLSIAHDDAVLAELGARITGALKATAA
jgi:glutamate-1-semialdehyde 2,1-aminomutase